MHNLKPLSRLRLSHGLGLILLATLTVGCLPQGYQTPKPGQFNQGLNSFAPDQEPAFTADGRYIVFSSARDGYQAVYLYDVNAEQLVELPGLNSKDTANYSPDISADGRFIVYLSNAFGKSDVFLYDRQTETVEPISVQVPGDVRHPTISGNGQYIAFESNGLGEWNIEIYNRGVVSQPASRNTQSR